MSDHASRPRPVDVSVYTRRRVLAMQWSDGHTSTYDWDLLRWNCPCAVCQGEWGAPGVLQSTTSLSAEQTTLIDLREIGRYALQPVWQDRHDDGIYTFDHLRRICPCPQCVGVSSTEA